MTDGISAKVSATHLVIDETVIRPIEIGEEYKNDKLILCAKGSKNSSSSQESGELWNY